MLTVNSIKIRFWRNSCIALILILPLSVFASQKGRDAFNENELMLPSGILLESPFPADSTAVRENALEMKKLALQGDQWLGADKFRHFGASLVLTATVKVLADNALNYDTDAATFTAAGFTMLAGFGKELCDDTHPSNIFSLKDLAADMAGVLVGVLLLQLL